MTIVVDASVWASFAMPRDGFHNPSHDWLVSVRRASVALVGPTLVLAEVTGAIVRRTGSHEAARNALRALRQIGSVELVAIDDALGTEAAELAAGLRLRGADAVYVATAAHLGGPLVTWDAEMITRTRGVIEARQPAA